MCATMNPRSLISSLRTFTRIVGLNNLRKSDLQLRSLTTNIHNFVSRPGKQRYLSVNKGPLRVISFEELKRISTENTLIIDVREPNELVTQGTIPGSINIPLGDLEKALKNLSEKEFLQKYGHKKPLTNHNIIFSCKTGNRSKKAQLLAVKLGYTNVINYAGGWTDWSRKSKSPWTKAIC